MKRVIILTPSLVNYSLGSLKIGGLETYVKDLALLCKRNGYEVLIFQYCTDVNIGKCFLEDVAVCPFFDEGNNQKGFNQLYKKYNEKSTVFILATDQMDIKSKANNVITIQHGVAFDIPGTMIKGVWGRNRLLQHINKTLRCLKNVRRLYNTRNTVCVDYNYYNWFRTLGTITTDHRVVVIPNYACKFLSIRELEEKLSVCPKKKKIVFARRFVEYRGTLMFANAVKRLLAERNDIEITFAGSGPLKNEVENMFLGNEQVHFSSFNAADTLEFHKKFDIAVVPTIFSEGTSLSLCEAMAAGCLGIATHVGGLTNILIDNYNGFLCSPSEESLYKTLSNVLDLQPYEYEQIVRCGYNTAIKGFSKMLWKKKWLKVLEDVC